MSQNLRYSPNCYDDCPVFAACPAIVAIRNLVTFKAMEQLLTSGEWDIDQVWMPEFDAAVVDCILVLLPDYITEPHTELKLNYFRSFFEPLRPLLAQGYDMRQAIELVHSPKLQEVEVFDARELRN